MQFKHPAHAIAGSSKSLQILCTKGRLLAAFQFLGFLPVHE